MRYQGSCHCGRVAFEVEGELEQVIDCNCSHCTRKGYLLWFVPREQLELATDDAVMSTYTFNKHAIAHRFCSHCGCAPLAMGTAPDGAPVAAINVRCLEDVDLAALKRVLVNGRSF